MSETDHTPQRIVSLQPSATVILHAVGRLERVVACTRYCRELCPEVEGRAIVQDSWTAQTEQIVALNPDLVIAAVPYQEKAVAEILKCGARFLGLAPKTMKDIYADIASIAGLVGRSAAGEMTIEKMKVEIDAIREQVMHRPRVRVYCEEWGKPLIASQAWVAELVSAAGGEFVGSPGSHQIADSIAKEDPHVVVAAWCGAGDRVPLTKIVAERGWQNMRAVQTGRVYCVRDDYLNTPAPTLLHGLRALAAAMHPDLFPQVVGLKCIKDL